jgi:hypothetical protein
MACIAPAHCVNGACLECTPNQVRCNASHTGLEVCDANGQWQPGMACVCIDPGQCDMPDASRGY